MVYQIPSESVLAVAIHKVVCTHEVISSQTKLADLTRDILKTINPEYHVTVERVRKVAIKTGMVTVDIKTRDDPNQKPSSECPVCGTKMNKVKNKTLYGKSVTLRYRCPKCRYSTGQSKSIPVRYSFRCAANYELSSDFNNHNVLRF